MRTYNANLMESQEMLKVTRVEARKAFNEGKNVYVRITPKLWIMTNRQEDEIMDDYEYGITFYLLNEPDDDKLIVTRHQNIADYFKAKGINARVVQAARVNDVRGKTIYGSTLPPHLMSFAKETYILTVSNTSNMDFESIPYSEFDSLGVSIKRYVVTAESVEL